MSKPQFRTSLLESLREDLYHIINGIYSGIPICCVLFFIRQHRQYDGIAMALNRKRRYVERCRYVRCDRCFRAGLVAVIKFNGNVATWLWNPLGAQESEK